MLACLSFWFEQDGEMGRKKYGGRHWLVSRICCRDYRNSGWDGGCWREVCVISQKRRVRPRSNTWNPSKYTGLYRLYGTESRPSKEDRGTGFQLHYAVRDDRVKCWVVEKWENADWNVVLRKADVQLWRKAYALDRSVVAIVRNYFSMIMENCTVEQYCCQKRHLKTQWSTQMCVLIGHVHTTAACACSQYQNPSVSKKIESALRDCAQWTSRDLESTSYQQWCNHWMMPG